MLMKWSDLEPGDIIRVTEHFRTKEWNIDKHWANKDLIVSKIDVRDDDLGKYIVIWCDNNKYNFHVLLNGQPMYYEEENEYFNIIKLSGE